MSLQVFDSVPQKLIVIPRLTTIVTIQSPCTYNWESYTIMSPLFTDFIRTLYTLRFSLFPEYLELYRILYPSQKILRIPTAHIVI